MKPATKDSVTGGNADVLFDNKWINNASDLLEASCIPSSPIYMSEAEKKFRQEVESGRTILDLIDF